MKNYFDIIHDLFTHKVRRLFSVQYEENNSIFTLVGFFQCWLVKQLQITLVVDCLAYNEWIAIC